MGVSSRRRSSRQPSRSSSDSGSSYQRKLRSSRTKPRERAACRSYTAIASIMSATSSPAARRAARLTAMSVSRSPQTWSLIARNPSSSSSSTIASPSSGVSTGGALAQPRIRSRRRPSMSATERSSARAARSQSATSTMPMTGRGWPTRNARQSGARMRGRSSGSAPARSGAAASSMAATTARTGSSAVQARAVPCWPSSPSRVSITASTSMDRLPAHRKSRARSYASTVTLVICTDVSPCGRRRAARTGFPGLRGVAFRCDRGDDARASRDSSTTGRQTRDRTPDSALGRPVAAGFRASPGGSGLCFGNYTE